MQLTKDYVVERLRTTSVSDLATEFATKAQEGYPAGTKFDLPATVKKFEGMLEPLAPKTITATEAMKALGIEVVRIK